MADDAPPSTSEWVAMKKQLKEVLRQNKDLLRRIDDGAPTINPGQSNAKLGCKPERYDGSRNPRAVENWLKSLDDYFELNPSQCTTERITILTAASYLSDPAKGDYNSYIGKHGEFATWVRMKKWLLETYSPVDPVNTYRDNFFIGTRQQTGESPDSFYRRFLDSANLLDTPIPDTYLTYFFAKWIIPYYRKQIQTDTEFAKWDKPIDDLVAKIKRGPPPPVEATPGRGSNTGNRQNLGKRISSSTDSRPAKRLRTSEYGPKLASGDDAPLTDGQRRFLDQNIAKGGGIVISPALQCKSAWVKEALKRNLCINCAASDHRKNDCPQNTEQKDPDPSTSNLNAILPGSDFVNNEDDDDYLN
jgi:hypothetical protein